MVGSLCGWFEIFFGEEVEFGMSSGEESELDRKLETPSEESV